VILQVLSQLFAWMAILDHFEDAVSPRVCTSPHQLIGCVVPYLAVGIHGPTELIEASQRESAAHAFRDAGCVRDGSLEFPR